MGSKAFSGPPSNRALAQTPRIGGECWGASRALHQEPCRDRLVGGGRSLPRTPPGYRRIFTHLQRNSLEAITGNFSRSNGELNRPEQGITENEQLDESLDGVHE